MKTKQQKEGLAVETAEKIVIDYANFSGREDTMRAPLRESATKHIKEALDTIYQQGMADERGKEHKFAINELNKIKELCDTKPDQVKFHIELLINWYKNYESNEIKKKEFVEKYKQDKSTT